MYAGSRRDPRAPPTPLLSAAYRCGESLRGEALDQFLHRPQTTASCRSAAGLGGAEPGDARASTAASVASRSGAGTAYTVSAARSTAAGTRSTALTRNSSAPSLQRAGVVAAARSKILQAAKREEEATLKEYHDKGGAMHDRQKMKAEAAERARLKKLAMPLHLRTGTNPLDMGCLPNWIPQTLRVSSLPVQMAVDPMWSSDLKKTNDRVGQRIEYERFISDVGVSSVSPEPYFMRKKTHVSNPGTPGKRYFEPGSQDKWWLKDTVGPEGRGGPGQVN